MTASRRESFVIDRPDFRFSLEPYEDFQFIHQEVRVFNRAVRRETQQIIDTLTGHGIDLRVFAAPNNRKLIRYAAYYGFVPSYTLTSPYDGAEYLILEIF